MGSSISSEILCSISPGNVYMKIDVMALEAISSAINSTLVPLLSSEVNLLRNIHSEVASIKDELESIMSFLKKADSSAELENGGAKIWVKQVRVVAYQIEDVMDEYILHLAKNRQRRGFLDFLRKLARSITKLKPRHDLASQIEDIKRIIRDIKERADRYGFSSIEHGSSSKTEEKGYDDPHLRHLIVNYGVEIQGGIGHLEELQTLKTILANDDLIKELENLRQLRKLSIVAVKREHAKALYTAVEKMNHLQSLYVQFIRGDTILDLHSLSSPPKSLQRLFLIEHLEMSPNWISRLDNLVSLDLMDSWLTGAHAIKALQALPNLIKLSFYQGYDGEQLYFDVGGFPKLKSLYLQRLGRLNSVIIEEGGLPVLEKLEIGDCPQLKETAHIHNSNLLLLLLCQQSSTTE
ncbi:hypothetical protein RHSIM_Rhsim02G0080700 [Rhododendron simsii]|uniref:Rx N-terminal domain-containing protein n=1 Tax=Rhododendron simsii TaxID=118357 RepID=A0A834HDX1_RHOSS|nr:hypothetical protein RHSIM_Rhsim02G0080700 [Rhododendron simsii]